MMTSVPLSADRAGRGPRSRWRRLMVSSALVLSASLALGGCGLTNQGQATFEGFAGETVEFVVPASPGGGSGTTAEILAHEFRRLSGDEMRIQPIYIDGGATVLGINDFAGRDPDGLSIGITTGTNNFYYNYGEPAAIYDYADWTPLMGLPQGRFVLVRSEIANMDPTQLPHLGEELIFGHMGQLGASSLEALMMDRILQIPTKHIFGYGGTSEIATAFDAGEVDALIISSGSYESLGAPLVENGTAEVFFVHPHLQDGEPAPDPFLPDAPTPDQVYERIYGTEPSGPAWDAYVSLLPSATTMAQTLWVHADAPEAAVEEWTELAERAAEDEEFLEIIHENVGYEPVVGEELDVALDQVLSFSDEHRNYILDFMVSEHGSSDPRS